MCGRYTRYLPWSEIHRLYHLTAPADVGRNDAPRYNIAPTDEVPFITAADDGNHRVRTGRWWLVPFWAKEMPKATMFNAKIETADTTPAFRDAFKSRRCLIPADGYYEWTKSPADGGKDPWHIFQPGHAPFSFAGLWAYNSNLDVTSCTIITQPSAAPINQIHDRQPLMLDPAYYDAWLDPKTPAADLKDILSHDIDGQLQFYRVGRDVNAAAINKQPNDHAGLIEPIKLL
ncbi:MAG: SOS response-associated peptidase [Mesorhizobium sp.]|uniref:SOS response-associated peptidase n=1 Tax=Mesorhizobium sp. TaxID=1871066 RepID=UPI001206B17B|nr:SOS response-associated peptidase [Mesorhizobium sp.]TIQ36273.1 MAG: SOS response-associated peptidase [Mesorhizobium sp.]